MVNPARYSRYRTHLARGHRVYVFVAMEEIRDQESEAVHGHQAIHALA